MHLAVSVIQMQLFCITSQLCFNLLGWNALRCLIVGRALRRLIVENALETNLEENGEEKCNVQTHESARFWPPGTEHYDFTGLTGSPG